MAKEPGRGGSSAHLISAQPCSHEAEQQPAALAVNTAEEQGLYSRGHKVGFALLVDNEIAGLSSWGTLRQGSDGTAVRSRFG